MRRFVQILDFHYNFIHLLEFKAKANDVLAITIESSYEITPKTTKVEGTISLSLMRPIGSVGVVIYHCAKRVAFKAFMDFKKTTKWVEFGIFL
jgi:hypothetical protein